MLFFCYNSFVLPEMFQGIQSGHFMWREEKIFNEVGLWSSSLFIWKCGSLQPIIFLHFADVTYINFLFFYTPAEKSCFQQTSHRGELICLVLPIKAVAKPQVEIRFSDSSLKLHPLWVLQLKWYIRSTTQAFADHIACWFSWDPISKL